MCSHRQADTWGSPGKGLITLHEGYKGACCHQRTRRGDARATALHRSPSALLSPSSLCTPQDTRHRPAQSLLPLLPMASRWICALSTALVWGCAAASSSSSHAAAAPPQDLHITDPGLLGSLDIEWKASPDAQTFNECTIKYRFEYHSAGDRDWKVIFTKKLKVRVGFDLSRIAEVRVQTLLEGRCTGGVEVQSDWIYATFQVPLQGKLESEVQNFHCIYHDWEYLKCTWQPGDLTPHSVQYGLYYWYEGLDHAVQCDSYVQENGMNIGCVLQNLSQAEYKDLSICVNGSVATALLRPLYITLRLHNLAKPSPPEQLVVSMLAPQELRLTWIPPSGKTPPQCLEYEVQLAEDDGENKASWVSVSTQMETTLTIYRANQSHVSCARVRGRTNIFCADRGFWSEWTQECFSVPRKEDTQLLILVPVILSLSSSLIIFMLIGQCKKRSPAGKPLHASVGC